ERRTFCSLLKCSFSRAARPSSTFFTDAVTSRSRSTASSGGFFLMSSKAVSDFSISDSASSRIADTFSLPELEPHPAASTASPTTHRTEARRFMHPSPTRSPGRGDARPGSKRIARSLEGERGAGMRPAPRRSYSIARPGGLLADGPDLHDAVLAGRRPAPPVRAERHRVDDAFVLLQRHQLAAAPGVPQP